MRLWNRNQFVGWRRRKSFEPSLEALVQLEQQRERTRPANAGQTWTRTEDAQVCEEVRRGIDFHEIAKTHNRTVSFRATGSRSVDSKFHARWYCHASRQPYESGPAWKGATWQEDPNINGSGGGCLHGGTLIEPTVALQTEVGDTGSTRRH